MYASSTRKLRDTWERKLDKLLPPVSYRKLTSQKRNQQRRRGQHKKASSTEEGNNTRQTTMVVNLSNATLSEAEINLLSKRLSFCPTPSRLETTEIEDDLESYYRYLRLKELLQTWTARRAVQNILSAHPSSWMPPKGETQPWRLMLRKSENLRCGQRTEETPNKTKRHLNSREKSPQSVEAPI